jgi:hypothetical protein
VASAGLPAHPQFPRIPPFLHTTFAEDRSSKVVLLGKRWQ